MRILRLEITGFGPFHQRQTLDFARAASDGILLIGGRTGSGKSSVLDAISFALYGAVPRYDGDAKRVRSDHCGPNDPTEVMLDFEMGGETFRVKRSPDWERPKLRGGGTTMQKGEAELWRWDEELGEWDGVAAKPREVAAELAPVLQLNHDQFLQVILLAQNRFQRFLHAKDDERQKLLRTLFATQRFDTIEKELTERRKHAEAVHGDAVRHIDGLLEQAQSRVEALAVEAMSAPHPDSSAAHRDALAAVAEHLRKAASTRHAEALAALAAETLAEEHLQATRHLLQRQLRLRSAHRDARALAMCATTIANQRLRFDAAQRAAQVGEALRRADAAATLRATAEELLATSGNDLAEERAAAVDFATLTAEQAHAATGTLTSLLEREARLAVRDEQIATLTAQVVTTREQLAAATSQRDALPTLVAEAEAREQAALASSAPCHELATALQHATAVCDAAALAVTRAAELENAQDATKVAADLAVAALQQYRDLVARRSAGAAGILASELRTGEPCPVCGSTTHPAPAAADDGAGQNSDISEVAIMAAQAEHDAAHAGLEAARRKEQEASSALAAARAEAGSRTVDEAEAAREQAELVHAAASAAAAELPILHSETEQLRTRRDAADATLHAATAQLAAAEAAVQSARDERDAEFTALEVARGTFTSLEARRDAVAALAAALDRHMNAVSEASRSHAADELAQREAAEALAANGFEDRAAAQAAELPADERDALAASIAAHDTQQQRVDTILADPELANVGSDHAPIVAREAELNVAREAARVAAKRDADAAHESDELDALLRSIDRQFEKSAAGAQSLALIRDLASTVEGRDPNTRRMRLEVFVLAARLEAIVDAANQRLSAMVAGRYTLEHDDGLQARGKQSGLGLRVLDEYTGRPRSTESLSGGETFLASLALALGLADVVTAEAGGISLDTIFIDEGFGSLDPDALGQAMAILDGLREGGRTVAVISHVAEMKEQIPARIEVVVDASGASRIEYGDTGGSDDAPGKDTPHDAW